MRVKEHMRTGVAKAWAERNHFSRCFFRRVLISYHTGFWLAAAGKGWVLC